MFGQDQGQVELYFICLSVMSFLSVLQPVAADETELLQKPTLFIHIVIRIRLFSQCDVGIAEHACLGTDLNQELKFKLIRLMECITLCLYRSLCKS